MSDFEWSSVVFESARSLLMAVIGGGIAAVACRAFVRRGIDHVFEIHQIRLEAELKRALKASAAELDVWAARQRELFKHLIESRSRTINDLLRAASCLRRALLGIGQAWDIDRIEELYREYCRLFYENPVLPREVFDSAHAFREASDRIIGAVKVARIEGALARDLVQELNAGYDVLIAAARNVLLPLPDD